MYEAKITVSTQTFKSKSFKQFIKSIKNIRLKIIRIINFVFLLF